MHKLLLVISVFITAFISPAVSSHFDQRMIIKTPVIHINPPIISTPAIIPTLGKLDTLSILAQSYLVYEPSTATVLVEKNGYTKRPTASTIKIMTAVLTIENKKMEEVITVSPLAASQPGSTAGLKAGEKITVENALYGLLLNSGNDCAWALAEYVGGTEERFVEMMNVRGKSLGLTTFHANDPAGLDESATTGTYASPFDIAKLLSYAMKYPALSKIMTTKNYTLYNTSGKNARILLNSNRFIQNDDNRIIGGKTGTGSNISVGGAGHVLVVAAKQDGYTIIAIVDGTTIDSNTASYDQLKILLDFTFANIVPTTKTW